MRRVAYETRLFKIASQVTRCIMVCKSRLQISSNASNKVTDQTFALSPQILGKELRNRKIAEVAEGRTGSEGRALESLGTECTTQVWNMNGELGPSMDGSDLPGERCPDLLLLSHLLPLSAVNSEEMTVDNVLAYSILH